MAYARRLGLSKAEQARFKAERRERDRQARLFWEGYEGRSLLAQIKENRRKEAERAAQQAEIQREQKEATKVAQHAQRMLAKTQAKLSIKRERHTPHEAIAYALQPMHIVARLNPNCYWCGLPFEETGSMRRTREHLVPKYYGGRDGHNIVQAHSRCNSQRGLSLNWVPFTEHGRLGECVIR